MLEIDSCKEAAVSKDFSTDASTYLANAVLTANLDVALSEFPSSPSIQQLYWLIGRQQRLVQPRCSKFLSLIDIYAHRPEQ